MLPSLTSIAARLKLRQLQFLIALDECRSLHKAAERAAITQSGATKALREIESTLGAVLFERSAQGVAPNDLGRCVVRYARLIQTDLAHLRDEMLGILQGHGGRLAVGAIMGAVPRLLPDALLRLRASQPGVSIEITEDTSARLLGLLDVGRLDLALCRVSVSRRPDAYHFEPVADEPLAVFAHPKHRLGRSRKLRLADLAGLPWVVYPGSTPMRLLLERELADAGLPMPAYPIETASVSATIALLRADRALVALLPADVGGVYEECGLVRRLPLRLGGRGEPYGIATRRDVQLSPVAALFVEKLREARTAPDPGDKRR
ncbi:LysR family transcriptional regulator [Pigmentiphaga soli]|uniref:LysR family transcriptional regulator n=1 Tax=Pigmentiphaga soli TaxID=1007095 RepID=A0ABP8H5F5_9BURK